MNLDQMPHAPVVRIVLEMTGLKIIAYSSDVNDQNQDSILQGYLSEGWALDGYTATKGADCYAVVASLTGGE